MRQGRLVEAYSLLYPWAAAHPADAEARLAAASLAVQLERPQEAEDFLSAPGLSKDDPAIQLLRGRVLTQKGDGAGAVALLEPLGKNHPPAMDLEIRRALAEAYLVANRPADAVKQLEGRAGQHPGLALLLGRAQRKAGNAAAALATLKPFADKLPADAASVGDPRPVLGIALETGALLTETGRAAEAVPVLEKATKLYPQSPPAWEALAKALEAAGRKDDARQGAGPHATRCFQAAAGLRGRRRCEALRRHDRGRDRLRRGPDREGPDRGAPRARGLARQPAGAGARDAPAPDPQAQGGGAPGPSRRRSARPRTTPTCSTCGAPCRWRSSTGTPPRRTCASVLQLAPQHTAAMNELAVVLMTRNQQDEAQALLEKVLQINPQDQVARASLETLKQGAAAPPKQP